MNNEHGSKRCSAENPRDITQAFGGSRAAKDRALNALTYIAMGLSVLWLGLILLFVFKNGASSVSPEFITTGYWSENVMVDFPEAEISGGSYPTPDDLPAGSLWSERYGFAVEDAKDPQHRPLLRITRMDPGSPLAKGRITTAGPTQGELRTPETGASITKLSYHDAAGRTHDVGTVFRHEAATMIRELDEHAVSLKQLYYRSPGGGIRGSLTATLQLIGITLLIAIPSGVMAAIYLHELAPKRKWVSYLRSSIEMLAGVPSVVFGLMGMTFFYPITKALGITGPSLLLGALTCSVLLLPMVIRQTEEALITVSDGFRMGSLALGATGTQTIFRVVLPNALPGILTSVLLAVSRVIGESAALIYTAGTFIRDDPTPAAGATSLSVQIWSLMSGEQPNFRLASAISLIILAIVLLLNISVKLLTRLVRRVR